MCFRGWKFTSDVQSELGVQGSRSPIIIGVLGINCVLSVTILIFFLLAITLYSDNSVRFGGFALRCPS